MEECTIFLVDFYAMFDYWRVNEVKWKYKQLDKTMIFYDILIYAYSDIYLSYFIIDSNMDV